ncbi:AI-2E family transporter [Dactylosporangium sucinum]|uniref:AI-2E family transporter n=1 Tax=Dactylosporangium sucinum TaxID=1424081 RepID=A0A917TXF5_9ACTN|nr:AI-2E family transporter [Dactylosporangium sucinum]GGM43161.1 AI-2E family transporter [Dactylosporangium sucinum]
MVSRRLSDRLQTVGSAAWSLVGVALLVVAAIALVIVLRSIVIALLVALFLAIAFLPVVDGLARRHVPRSVGAAATILLVIVLGAGAIVLVLWGVASQREQISQNLNAAVGELHGILTSAGANGNIAEAGRQSVGRSGNTILAGLLPALGNLLGTSVNLLLGLFVALFVCFFLLKNGHAIAARAAGRLPLPEHLGQRLLGRAATVIRRYYVGLTLIGAFNAVAVAIGALILRVPLVAAIAVITFLGAYVPYLGAAVASAFAVLIALGSGGQTAALWMILVVILANGLLQNLVSPLAFGAALRMSAPAVLLATLVGGALAGVAGLALATPVTAIVARSIEVLREPPPAPDTDDQPLPEGPAPGGQPARPDPEQ